MRQVYFYISPFYVDAYSASSHDEAALEFHLRDCNAGLCISLKDVESLGVDRVKNCTGQYLDHIQYEGSRFFLENPFATTDSMRETIIALVESP